jgi:hypothetical protein
MTLSQTHKSYFSKKKEEIFEKHLKKFQATNGIKEELLIY